MKNWSTISLLKHQFIWMSERWLDVFSALGCLLMHCCSKMDIIWKLHSCWSQYVKHPIIVQGKTRGILVCEWDMKLGIVPILTQNCEKPWFFTILGQNSTYSKMDIIWKLYSCWSQWCKPYLHTCISFLAWDTYHNSYPMYPSTWMKIGIVNPSIWMKYSDRDCANEAYFILNSAA